MGINSGLELYHEDLRTKFGLECHLFFSPPPPSVSIAAS